MTPRSRGRQSRFESTATDDDGDIVSTDWDFNYDGTFNADASGTTAGTSYGTAGPRTVAMRVTDTDAVDGTEDVDIATRVVSVTQNAAPTASLTVAPNPARIGQTVNFNAAGSGDSDGSIVNYEWDLDGNGTYETDTDGIASASRSYTTAGARTVRVRVTDDLGLTGTDTASLVINAPPSASFSMAPNPAAIGETVNFDASGSSDSDGMIVNYEWDLDGNGTYETDTDASPTTSQSYMSGGARTIRVRVTDNDGSTAVDTDTLFVNNTSPSASFTMAPNPAQLGQTVNFNAGASNDPDGSIARYEWDLDGNGTYETDGGSSSTTTQAYATAGTRTIRLRVTDDDGTTATDADSLRINARPTPSFTLAPNPAVIGETVAFDAGSSEDIDGSVAQYEWDLDGNGTYEVNGGSTPTTSRSYPSAGSRTIRLRVTDNDGAINTLARTLVVQTTRPNASFTFAPQAPLPGQPIGFTSQSTPSTSPGNPTIESTEWDFNYDPTKEFSPDASGTSASTSYSTPGPKTVGLRVTESGGGFAVTSLTVVVNAPPTASFNVAPASPFDGDSVTFSSTSGDPDGPLTGIQWDLDADGQYDDASGPVVSRAYATGARTVRLLVTDSRGATAAAERRFDVVKRPARLLGGVKVSLFGNLTDEGARLKRLLVRTPARATAKVTCKGRDCPKGTKSVSKRTPKTRRLRFKKFERSFVAGSLLTITVSRPGYIGSHTTIKIRGNLRRYIRRDRCLPPGGGKPIACPDS